MPQMVGDESRLFAFVALDVIVVHYENVFVVNACVVLLVRFREIMLPRGKRFSREYVEMQSRFKLLLQWSPERNLYKRRMNTDRRPNERGARRVCRYRRAQKILIAELVITHLRRTCWTSLAKRIQYQVCGNKRARLCVLT